MILKNRTLYWLGIILLAIVAFRPNPLNAQSATPIDHCTGGFQFHRLEPLTLVAEQGGEITAYGCEFVDGMNIRVVGIGLIPTSIVSPFVMTASVPGGAAIGQYDVQIVKNNDAITFPAKLNLIATPLPALPKLAVHSVEPLNIVAQDGGEITILGDGFDDATVVRLPGIGVLPTTVVNRNTLLATIAAGLPQNQYDLQIARGNDVVTFGRKLNLIAPWQPTLQISTLEPSVMVAVDGGTLTVIGNGFDETTTVRIPSVGVMETTFVNPTLLRVAIPGGLPLGNYDVQVVRANQVVTFGKKLNLTAPRQPALQVSTLEPSMMVAADGGTLTILGNGFDETTTVRIPGVGVMETTFVNPTLLRAAIPGGLPLGNYAVQVVRGVDVADAPSGLALKSMVLTGLSVDRFEPLNLVAQTGGIVSVYGNGFTENSAVRLVGQGLLPTTFISANLLSAEIPPDLLPNQYGLEVVRGNETATANTMLNLTRPTTVAEWFKAERIEPISMRRNSGGSLTIYGQGFSGNLVVRLVGYGALVTEVRNRHTLVATVPSGLPAGKYDVQVIGDQMESPVIGQLAISFPVVASQAVPLTIVPPPQLVITNTVVAPAMVQPGEQFTLSFELFNAGQKAANNVLTSFQANPIAAPISGSGTQLVPEISAEGTSQVVTFELVATDSAEPGQHSITILLDFADNRGNSFSTEQVIGVTVSDVASSSAHAPAGTSNPSDNLLVGYAETRGIVSKRVESIDADAEMDSIVEVAPSIRPMSRIHIPEAIKVMGDIVKPVEVMNEVAESAISTTNVDDEAPAEQPVVHSSIQPIENPPENALIIPLIVQMGSIVLALILGMLLTNQSNRRKSD